MLSGRFFRCGWLAVALLPGAASGLGACSAGGGPSGQPGGAPSGTAGTASSTAGSGTETGGAALGGAAVGGGAGNVAAAGTSGTGGTASVAGAGGSVAGSTSGGAGGAGGAGAQPCPTDATFCSGFEEATLPTAAVYKVNAAPGDWTRDFELDTSVFHAGKAALRVKASSEAGTSGSSYQMLAVPAPMGKFWARFYIRQADLDIGGLDHNVFAGAADSDEPNSTVMVELAEDVGVAFNTNDVVRWPTNFGRVNGGETPFTLAKGMWHCIEISYDGAARAQQLYVNGMQQIDAPDYPATVASPFKIFKFGFNKLHGPARAVWYDDVAVGPTRPGCL
jgi:hypothetical protein